MGGLEVNAVPNYQELVMSYLVMMEGVTRLF